MTTVERLKIVADVADDFSEELLQLSSMLIEVGEIADELDPITVSTRGVESATAKFTALSAAMEGVDDDVSIGGGDSFDVAATPSMGSDGGSTAVADGRGGNFLDGNDIRRLSEAFGDAFDADTLANQGGEIMAPSRLIRGNLSEYVDADGLARGVASGDVDIEALGGLDANSIDDFMRSMNELSEYIDLPAGDTLSDTLSGLNLNMSHFYDILASLLPLIGVFVGAIPAAITAVGALATAALGAAAALGGITLLGVMGMGLEDGKISTDVFQRRIGEIAQDFVKAFGPLANDLSPLAEEAVDGMGILFDRIAAYGDVLRAFKDDARAFGQYLLDTTPIVLAKLVAMGDMFGEVFGKLAQYLGNAQLLSYFSKMFAESSVSIGLLIASISAFLPYLVNLSQGFLDVATVIMGVVGVFSHLFNQFPLLTRAFGGLIGLFLVGISTVATFAAVHALLNSQMVAAAVTTLSTYVPAIQWATATTWHFAASLIAATGGLAAIGMVIGAGISQMTDFGDSVQSATGDLKDFKSVSDSISGPSASMGSGTLSSGSYIDYSTANVSVTVDGGSDTQDTERATQAASYRTGTSLDQYFSN